MRPMTRVLGQLQLAVAVGRAIANASMVVEGEVVGMMRDDAKVRKDAGADTAVGEV